MSNDFGKLFWENKGDSVKLAELLQVSERTIRKMKSDYRKNLEDTGYRIMYIHDSEDKLIPVHLKNISNGQFINPDKIEESINWEELDTFSRKDKLWKIGKIQGKYKHSVNQLEEMKNMFKEMIIPFEMKDPIVDRPVGNGEKIVLRILISDVHFGKITSSFNLEVCKRRLEYYKRKVIENYFFLLNKYEITKVEFVILGDIIDGNHIYPTHPHNVEVVLFEQVFKRGLVEIFAEFIKELHCLNKNLVVVCNPGNHGRSTKYDPHSNNADMYFFFCLKYYFSNYMDIKFHIPETVHSEEKLFLSPYSDSLNSHGHITKGGKDGALVKSIIDRVKEWKLGGRFGNFKFYNCGHYHSNFIFPSNFGITVVSNGTFVSDDTHSIVNFGSDGSGIQYIYGINELGKMEFALPIDVRV